MTTPDTEFDPDDNFANALEPGADFDSDEASTEALVWQLLLLINPGDEDTALQQFAAYRERIDADLGGAFDQVEPIVPLREVIDWTSGFYVEDGDTASLIDSVNELAARWNLRIEWGVEDPSDEVFLAATDVPALMATAYDRLREYDYSLWTWHTGEAAHAGWITRRQDGEAIQAVAAALGIELRPGSEAF
ncbi:MAG: hypothetical protein KY442_01260 [Proteobacteria bacterium]|nr:hypothetical protein [Pseudomonadota bacterium]